MIRTSPARLALSLTLTATLLAGLTACGSDAETPAEEPSNNGPTTTPVTDNNDGASNNGASNNGASNNGTSNNGTNNEPTVTYHQDVAPLLDARCTGCHVEGGIAPFPLTSYEEVFPRRGQIASVTTEGVMPPFLFDNDCRDYQHDPTLSDAQLEMLRDWADQGGPEGDPDGQVNAVEPLPAGGLSRVDLTLQMPVEYTPTKSPDDYRCFILDWPHDTRKFITGLGVRPGNDELVHHVVIFRIAEGNVAEAEALDAAEEGPGYTCFGGPRVGGDSASNLAWLGSWAPGGRDSDFPEGTGLPVDPGSKIVLQVHYNTIGHESGHGHGDQTALELKVDDTVEKEAMFMPWASPQWLQGNMNIPAGEAEVEHSFSFDPTLYFSGGKAIDIYSAALHMHLLGTSARAAIVRSGGGGEDCLADIPRWDFNWQNGVRFAEPARLEPGDLLSLGCTWDNSADNQPVIDGEQIEPADRNWGDGTTDEMCLGIFYATVAD